MKLNDINFSLARILAFRAFLLKEFSEENLDFWIEVESYRKQRQAKQIKLAPIIYDTYVKVGAAREVNESILLKITKPQHRYWFLRKAKSIFCGRITSVAWIHGRNAVPIFAPFLVTHKFALRDVTWRHYVHGDVIKRFSEVIKFTSSVGWTIDVGIFWHNRRNCDDQFVALIARYLSKQWKGEFHTRHLFHQPHGLLCCCNLMSAHTFQESEWIVPTPDRQLLRHTASIVNRVQATLRRHN